MAALKPGGLALIVAKDDSENTGKEVVTLHSTPCTCGKTLWAVRPVNGLLVIDIIPGLIRGKATLAHYHSDELMPIDPDDSTLDAEDKSDIPTTTKEDAPMKT